MQWCSAINTPFTQTTDYQCKKLPQDNNTTVDWCLKQQEAFILRGYLHCQTILCHEVALDV